MKPDNAYQLLKKSINALSDIPDELIDSLFAICRLTRVDKGKLFVRAGEVPDIVGFNLDGLFRLFYIDDDGNDLTKGFSTPGKFVVSYSAMVQNRPSYFFIEALSHTHILEFKYSRWIRMAEQNIRWYPLLFKLVEAVYIMKELREKSFLIDDATTRYLAFQKEYPGLESKIKLYHIASFIGITPGALSRIRKNLKN